MANYLNIFFLLSVLFFNSLSQISAQRDNIIIYADDNSNFKLMRKALYLKEVLDTNFTGEKVIENIKEQIRIIDSLPYFFYPKNSLVDVKIKIIKSYRKGVKIRSIAYYPNGDKYREVNFNNKGRNGKDCYWYPNGQILSMAFYGNDSLISPMIYWYTNGKVMMVSTIGFIENGTSTVWYGNQNGSLAERTVSYGENKSEVVNYYPNGTLMEKLIHGMGIQELIQGHDNGNFKAKGMIKNSIFYRVGKWEYWYYDGQKSMEAYYHDTIPNYSIGTWKYWDEQGHLIKEETYTKGELKDTKGYLPKMVEKR